MKDQRTTLVQETQWLIQMSYFNWFLSEIEPSIDRNEVYFYNNLYVQTVSIITGFLFVLVAEFVICLMVAVLYRKINITKFIHSCIVDLVAYIAYCIFVVKFVLNAVKRMFIGTTQCDLKINKYKNNNNSHNKIWTERVKCLQLVSFGILLISSQPCRDLWAGDTPLHSQSTMLSGPAVVPTTDTVCP